MALIKSTGTAGSLSRMHPRLFPGTPARVVVSFIVLAGLMAWVLSAVSAQDTSTPAADSASGTPEATPSATMPRIELELEEANESDLGGTVTLYELGDVTIVDFAVTGAGGDHPAVILPGVCDETTDTTGYALEPISNTGESITTVDVPLEDLLAEDHVVQVLMSDEDRETVIACAVIEGEPGLEIAATPEASPSASPEAPPSATDAEGVGGQNTTTVDTATTTPVVATDGTSGAADTGTDAVGSQNTTATNTAVTTPVTDVDGTSGVADPNAATLTVKLADWSDTGITGTAVLTADGSATVVTVTLTGDGITGGHEMHIHNGTCASPGTATYTLTPIDANGSSTSTVNLSLEQLTSGSYFINVHPNEANWDAWMVCGNITGTATSLTQPTATVPVASTVSDGSAGGNTTMVTTNAQAAAFPQTVGVGDGLEWPNDTRTAVIWAIAGSTIILAGTGLLIRFGERHGKQPRFTRLGL